MGVVKTKCFVEQLSIPGSVQTVNDPASAIEIRVRDECQEARMHAAHPSSVSSSTTIRFIIGKPYNFDQAGG